MCSLKKEIPAETGNKVDERDETEPLHSEQQTGWNVE